MSNSQWHSDQAAGERAQRQHDQRVSAVDDLVEACLAMLAWDKAEKAFGFAGTTFAERTDMCERAFDLARAALRKAGVEP